MIKVKLKFLFIIIFLLILIIIPGALTGIVQNREKSVNIDTITLPHIYNVTNYSIDNVDIVKSKPPEIILNAANDYVKSFVDEEDFNGNFRLGRLIIFDDENTLEYMMVYYLQIEKLRENGKRIRSSYKINVRFDEDGNIIDESEPRNKYNSIKNEGGE